MNSLTEKEFHFLERGYPVGLWVRDCFSRVHIYSNVKEAMDDFSRHPDLFEDSESEFLDKLLREKFKETDLRLKLFETGKAPIAGADGAVLEKLRNEIVFLRDDDRKDTDALYRHIQDMEPVLMKYATFKEEKRIVESLKEAYENQRILSVLSRIDLELSSLLEQMRSRTTGPISQVRKFRNEHYFLSNFYPVKIKFEGLEYLSLEAAYQAAKFTDPALRETFTALDARTAKKLASRLPVRPDWEQVRLELMERLVEAKFEQHPELADLLHKTGDALLLEGNDWGDTFWGIDLITNQGKNHLGKILMHQRKRLLTKQNDRSGKEIFSSIASLVRQLAHADCPAGFELNYLEAAARALKLYGKASALMEEEGSRSELTEIENELKNFFQ